MRCGSNLNLTAAISRLTLRFLGLVRGVGRLEKVAQSLIFAARKTCTKGGADGYPNLCGTRRKNAAAGNGFGDTTQQIGNAREVETLWPAEISAERISSSVARLTSNSIDELQGLASGLQKMQEFLKSEVDNVWMAR